MQTANFIVEPEESSARRGRWHAQPDLQIQLKLHPQLQQRDSGLKLHTKFFAEDVVATSTLPCLLPRNWCQPDSKIYVLCSWALALTW